MADEQDRWLDRGTAERLLNGEPPEAADPATRDQAERLAGTLRALSGPPPSADGELPGEAAALAAFRASRAERQVRAGADRDTAHHAGTKASGPGPVRVGAARGDRSGTADGPRPWRPLRLGLAAALVAGMVGGAAVLAGAGVLPTPSDETRSGPAASVTATATHPERPLPSSPPGDGGATPGGAHSESAAGRGEDGSDARGDGDADAPGKPGPDAGDPAARSGRGGKLIASACRAWREGKQLNGERKRLLENAAGGPSRVGGYCAHALSAEDTEDTKDTNGAGGAERTGEAKDADDTGSGAGNGTGEGTGKDQGGDDGKGNGSGGSEGQGQGRDRGADKGGSGQPDHGNAPGNRP
ncbi:hypothetical protein ACFVZC_24475 [Streptomyces marokkonensis]|uniref:Extensin n=1 Tax=Streptomyces marokkonensis TaxID=324855 RepID=A0ABW6QBL6_9ACTN